MSTPTTTWPDHPSAAAAPTPAPVPAEIAFLRTLPAGQQPDWNVQGRLDEAVAHLTRMPPIVSGPEVRTLRALLAQVAAGRMMVLQAGDCAEDPAECTAPHVLRKAALLDILAGVLHLRSGKPVLRVGRIAGQFGKPRSYATEVVDGCEMPVFRGHLINSPEPVAHLRRPQPERLLTGYHAARTATDVLRLRQMSGDPTTQAPVWTSHEALLLDYELPLLRREQHGATVLSSTHWPWIGERTRQVDGAHVAMLSMVDNPVACKVGPRMEPETLLALCERLDPLRTPGRLTLISRMGMVDIAKRLPALVEAVRAAGHPVVWLCDPMHGNTVTTRTGLKTRVIEDLVSEVAQFHDLVGGAGAVAGGLHLETTPDDVSECLRVADGLELPEGPYTTTCDPRLNLHQAITVVSAWKA